MSKASNKSLLTDLEGAVIAFVLRRQPCTPYTIRQSFENSPTTKFSNSAGSIYPLVQRLAERKLLVVQEKQTSGRRSTTYRVTPEGRRRVKAWLSEFGSPTQIGVYDPIRTRLANLSLLSHAGQIEWLDNMLSILRQQKEVIADYESQEIVGEQILHAAVCEMLRAENELRIKSLQRVRHSLRRAAHVA